MVSTTKFGEKMFHENAQNLIKKVKNPKTGRSLDEEGRIIEVNTTESQIDITYKRDGISPKEKRK